MSVYYSIIIPVLHEEKIIKSVIGKLQDIFSGTDYEIIIVDGSAGRTTIKVIEESRVVKEVSEKGRAVQMNKGAAIARGKVLIFLHADTELPERAPLLIKNAVKQNVKAGAFDLQIDTKNRILQLISKTSRLRSRITRVPYGDQVHFFQRSYFFDIGTYKEIPLMEDVEIMRRIKRRGDRIQIIKSAAITSDRKWQRDGVLYGMIRNPLLSALFFVGVPPRKLVRLYYKKKIGDTYE